VTRPSTTYFETVALLETREGLDLCFESGRGEAFSNSLLHHLSISSMVKESSSRGVNEDGEEEGGEGEKGAEDVNIPLP
jgi:hypothetical protein